MCVGRSARAHRMLASAAFFFFFGWREREEKGVGSHDILAKKKDHRFSFMVGFNCVFLCFIANEPESLLHAKLKTIYKPKGGQ